MGKSRVFVCVAARRNKNIHENLKREKDLVTENVVEMWMCVCLEPEADYVLPNVGQTEKNRVPFCGS